jgi:hypothetical protein
MFASPRWMAYATHGERVVVMFVSTSGLSWAVP